MKIYSIVDSCKLPLTLNEAWEFMSSPANLNKITPPDLSFEITSPIHTDKMFSGQIITYRIMPFPGIPMNWVTEITHVNEPYYFVDEQRFGPYAFWHHKHFIKEIEGGVEMQDVVHYALPFGIIGNIAKSLFIGKKLEHIFKYRKLKLEELFGIYGKQ